MVGLTLKLDMTEALALWIWSSESSIQRARDGQLGTMRLMLRV